ncbi:PaaI family thioesterase [Desulfoplanes formicivorans]|uniref:Acyl-CoA thioesterase n=1 Tax=Desulfoplanes formicivorans TaxID=1592317 RepID=A0A194ADY2_9BACT|nr:PaaI family thioesterase [Desulfoplanes formicivorans]GAU08287.1 acyl-CoA thioesterase [Desulfoplanes formicivorans]
MAEHASTGPHEVTLDTWIATAPFEDLLGMKIISASNGHAVLTMPFVRVLAQGLGFMHGGALVSLADTAVAMAAKSLLPPGTVFATTSITNRFLHPVTRGVVTARAVMTGRRGRDLMGNAEVTDEDGRVVMRFGAVFRVARKSWPHVQDAVCRALDERP